MCTRAPHSVAGKLHATAPVTHGRRVTAPQPRSSLHRRGPAHFFAVETLTTYLGVWMFTQIALLLTISVPGPAPVDSIRADRDIRLVALRNVADVRRCYEREGLTRDPRLTGTLDVTVTVQATGVVSGAAVTAHRMRGVGAREMATCLTTAMRNWRFDRGPYVVETIVFPFSFKPEQTGAVRASSVRSH